MAGKQIIDGKECRYWFRLNPSDYRKCSLRGENDNCDEIKDCFVKELLGKLALKEQECERLNEYSVGFARKCQKLELDVCHLKDKNYNLQRRLDQLKQTLTEIKDYCNKYPQNSIGFKKYILQKISECEEEK